MGTQMPRGPSRKQEWVRAVWAGRARASCPVLTGQPPPLCCAQPGAMLLDLQIFQEKLEIPICKTWPDLKILATQINTIAGQIKQFLVGLDYCLATPAPGQPGGRPEDNSLLLSADPSHLRWLHFCVQNRVSSDYIDIRDSAFTLHNSLISKRKFISLPLHIHNFALSTVIVPSRCHTGEKRAWPWLIKFYLLRANGRGLNHASRLLGGPQRKLLSRIIKPLLYFLFYFLSW